MLTDINHISMLLNMYIISPVINNQHACVYMTKHEEESNISI